MYILQHDFEIEPQELSILEGEITSEMMRHSPYYRVTIDSLNRVAYICDEEGNATYIFDTAILTENGIDIHTIDLDSKDEKNELIRKYPGCGIRIVQSKHWRTIISDTLENSIPVAEGIEVIENISEFKKENKEFLSFEDFQNEVRALYPGEGDVQKWYKHEYKKHKGWPSNPAPAYSEKGWIGWPELVGKENPLKKEFLPFEDFQNEVRESYPGEGDIQRWYKKEYKNHKGWPAGPKDIYKDEGWIGWPEVVGKENFLKKEYLGFEDFQNEIRKLYTGETDIHTWYQTIHKDHPNWPYNPDRKYKGKGWTGWLELVGKEKKEYPTYNQFQNEVSAVYPGKGNVQIWYQQEYTKHKNWPTNPHRYYKDSGWIGWAELVGRENHTKKGFLPFEDFRKEIRAAYSGQPAVKKWYREEYKKHQGWPSEPEKEYKDTGWPGLSNLIHE
jgi:hypothetical protein